MLFTTSKSLARSLAQTVRKARFSPLSAEIKALFIHIYDQGLVTFTRNIEWTPAAGLESIPPLGEEEKRGVLEAVATQSFPYTRFEVQNRALYTSVLDEIERAQNFYKYTLKQREVAFKRLIVTGQITLSFTDELQDRLGFPIEQLDFTPLQKETGIETDLNGFSVPIGLALRGKTGSDRDENQH